MRRGRRDPEPCEVGDAVDLWRVVAFDADRRLTLVAELKMPGRAWLQFDGLPATGRELPAFARQRCSIRAACSGSGTVYRCCRHTRSSSAACCARSGSGQRQKSTRGHGTGAGAESADSATLSHVHDGWEWLGAASRCVPNRSASGERRLAPATPAVVATKSRRVMSVIAPPHGSPGGRRPAVDDAPRPPAFVCVMKSTAS
jgi:Protein of unknown function (DUF2867)